MTTSQVQNTQSVVRRTFGTTTVPATTAGGGRSTSPVPTGGRRGRTSWSCFRGGVQNGNAAAVTGKR